MHLQRNWVLAFVAIAGCAMFVFAIQSLAKEESPAANSQSTANATEKPAANSSANNEGVPKIAGKWTMKGFADGCTIVSGNDPTVYKLYFGPHVGQSRKPDYDLKWNADTKTFEVAVKQFSGMPFSEKSIVTATVEDNGNTLHVEFARDEDARTKVVESLKQMGMTEQELELVLDQKWTRSKEINTPVAKTLPAEIIPTEQPATQNVLPDIAGEWIQKSGESVDRFKIVQSKSKLAEVDIYQIQSKPDQPFYRLKWNSTVNAFVGKLVISPEEPIKFAMKVTITATVENDGQAILVSYKLDPETVDRITTKHGKETADEMLGQYNEEFIWTREPATAISQAPAVELYVPSIGGTWLMGDQGSFGNASIVRSGELGYAFDVYYYKPVKDTAQPASPVPTYRLKWDPSANAFESSTRLAINSKLPGTATVKITVEENGTALRVKMIPDEEGVKTLEAIKQRGPSQKRAIEQWLDMKWTQVKDSPQGPFLTDDLLNALSQAKPPAGSASGGQGSVGGFGGGLVGGGGFGGTGAAPGFAMGGRIANEVERYRDRIESKDLLLIETSEGLSAYSKSLGKWSALKVGLPKNGKNRLTKSTASETFVSVIIDDQLYGYSSQVGAWDQISIPQELQNKVKPVHGVNVLFVAIGDRTYALSSKTGKWTASDQPVSGIELTESLPARSFELTQDLNITPQKLAASIAEHEASASRTAKEIRKILEDSADAKDGPEVQKLRAKLETTLSKTFDLKTQLETSRVQDLQSRLKRLEQQLGRRQSQRTKIIDRHLHDLIEGEDTDWTTDATNEGNPQPAQTGGGFF